MDDLFNTLTGGQAEKDQDDPQEDRGSQSSGSDRDALNDLLGGMMGGAPQSGDDAPDLGGLLGGMLGGSTGGGDEAAPDLGGLLGGMMGGSSGASGGSPDMGGLLGGLLGGSGGSQAGGMSGLLGGMLGGGGSSQSGNPMVDTIANMLADKMGISPSVASTLVSAAIPLLMGALTKGAGQQGSSRSGEFDLDEMDLPGLVEEEMQEQGTVHQIAAETGMSEEEADQALRETLQMLAAGVN